MKQSDRWELTTILYLVSIFGICLVQFIGIFNTYHASFGTFLLDIFSRPVNEARDPSLIISYGCIVVVLLLPGIYFKLFKLHNAVILTIITICIFIVLVPIFVYFGLGVLPFVTISVSLLFGFVLAVSLTLIFSSAEKDLLKNAFSRYVSKEVLKDLLKDPDGLAVMGREKQITVLFLDIRGFTSFAEAHDPELVVKRLNELLEFVADIVMSHKGFIDKYMGDAVMAIWGAPASDTKQCTHALSAAVKIRDTINAKSQFKVGIGIHFGTAIVGNVGSSTRMDFTAIGDTVNTASRLQTASKELGQEIIISENVREKAYKEHTKVMTIELGKTLLRGKSQSISTYGVISVH